MDIKRLTSGLLGFPLVLLVLLIGDKIVVDIALSIIALLAMSEYFNAIAKVSKPVRWLGYLSCFSIAFIHVVPKEYLNMIGVPTILIVLFAQVVATEMRTTFKDIAYTFIGIFYVVFFIMFVAFIDGMPNGKILIWYVILAAWGTDIFAYFAGYLFGKHKLIPKVSPKKTIEGSIGGILGSTLVCLGFGYYFNLNLTMIILLGFFGSIIAQMGDLFASSIKRYVGIKDYGKLIPGHGGVLDRFDSVILVAPFVYSVINLFIQ